VSAAAKISRVAVGDPEISPLDVTYTVKGDLSQTTTVDGLPMGTRGGTAIRHNFPLDGEYLLKLSLQKLSFGQVFGSSAEGEMLEVTLNGERVKLYQLDDMPYFFMRDKPGQPIPLGPLKDPSAERLRMSPNINMEFRLKVKAGPQDIGVSFLNTSYVANEDLVHRPGASTFDSNNGMQYGYYTVPHLAKVDITGPYNATGSGDTPSRRKIFVCRPAREAQGLASPKPQEKAGEAQARQRAASGGEAQARQRAASGGEAQARQRAASGGEAQARQRAASGDAELACSQKIISNLVRHAFRRPATDNDVELLTTFYQQGRDNRNKGSFDAGIEMALRRILADPEFVFRFETPPANVKPGEAYRLGDLELASRLSFFLWSSIPDDRLLDTAIQGKLHEPAVLDRETRRMLKDPRADALVHNFAGQWLFLRDLKSTNPDSREFPDFDDNLRQSFVRETEMLFESVLREDRSVLDLLDADYTFVNERLAKHYGIPGIYGPDFRRVTVPSDARRGLLGQGSMLLVTSNANRTSPVQRGKWILENILGSPPPLPPPNVPPLKESVVGAKPTSVRDRMEEHRSNPVCAACHKIMDPIGLALENFDGTGQWRTMDSGFSIDPSSQLVDGTILDGPSSLRKALLSRPEAVVGTMTQKLLMYGIGRETKYNDMPVVRAIMRGAEPNRYKFSDLILGVVRSAPFQMRVKENSSNSEARAR
jgi:hypothetical protein